LNWPDTEIANLIYIGKVLCKIRCLSIHDWNTHLKETVPLWCRDEGDDEDFPLNSTTYMVGRRP